MRYLIRAINGPHPSWFFRGGQHPHDAWAWTQDPERAKNYQLRDAKRILVGSWGLMLLSPKIQGKRRRRQMGCIPSVFKGLVVCLVPFDLFLKRPSYEFQDTLDGHGRVIPI